MSTVHRALDGAWAECAERACELLFHFPNMTVEAASAMPMHALLPLFDILDPPTSATGDRKVWQDANGERHRDYDLPALIGGHGTFAWYQHGQRHRDHDRPAIISALGRQQWYQQGRRHREHGPAIIEPNGRDAYWYRGTPVDPR